LAQSSLCPLLLQPNIKGMPQNSCIAQAGHMQFKLSEGNDNFSVDIIVIDVSLGLQASAMKVRND